MLQESPLPVTRSPPRHALAAELRALGLQPRLLAAGHGVTAGGVALSLSLADMVASPERAAHLLARLRTILVQRIPTTLTLAGLGGAHCGMASLQRVCRRLDAVLSAPCIDRRRLGIAVHARDLALPAFRLVCRVLLGHGARYLLLDERHLEPRDDAAAALWSSLYLQRQRAARVLPVYGGGVRTRCALLGDEACGALLPQRSILVPPDSAWLPLDLHLQRYADARGAIDVAVLERALRQGLGIADRLFDRLCWPDRLQQGDAWLNRRIAVTLHGIGDLVQLQGGDPAGLGALRRWERLLTRIHRCLWERSRQLATERGLLPALACRNPSQDLSDGRQRRDWQERWQNALASAAVRHRNLLVMSPYDVLPRCGARQADYADLLPLLAHADALSFAGAGSFAGWSVRDFRQFHCRAHAIVRRRNATAFIAADA